MKLIIIDKVKTQPENVSAFAQFLLCRLLEQGPALLEADGMILDTESIEWRLTPRRQLSEPPPVVRSDRNIFRSTLAGFGLLCGISPLSGHGFFHLRFTDEEEARPERFAIYLCNEPTMGFWIRIYLYAIDGAYPNYGGMYDKNPNPVPLEA